MSAFIFTCPTTKLNVQHWPENDKDISENEYEGITWPRVLSTAFHQPQNRRASRQERAWGPASAVDLTPLEIILVAAIVAAPAWTDDRMRSVVGGRSNPTVVNETFQVTAID